MRYERDKLRRERERRLAEEEEYRRRLEEHRRFLEEQAQSQREHANQARLEQEEADRCAAEAAAEAHFQARSEMEAIVLSQRVISGSIVTCSAGLEIQHITTGFKCCVVKTNNLPMKAREDEAVALFTQQGVEPARFLFVDLKSAPNGRKTATVATAADLADLLSFGLNGVEFRDETINFEIGAYNVPGGMGVPRARCRRAQCVLEGSVSHLHRRVRPSHPSSGQSSGARSKSLQGISSSRRDRYLASWASKFCKQPQLHQDQQRSVYIIV